MFRPLLLSLCFVLSLEPPLLARVPDSTFFNTIGGRGALLIGIVMGTVLFWIDAHRAGATRSLLPVLKFVGPVMGLVIAYAFLAEQLGLTSQNRVIR